MCYSLMGLTGYVMSKLREDPEVNALGTPSGYIEIFSRRIASYGYDDCPGHPIWMEKVERSGG
ncbi:trimethylamine-N-oxide reductase TorA [Oligella ureolytica]